MELLHVKKDELVGPNDPALVLFNRELEVVACALVARALQELIHLSASIAEGGNPIIESVDVAQ